MGIFGSQADRTKKKSAPVTPDINRHREYRVASTVDNETGLYTSFFVTDCFDHEELQSETRPGVVTFKVSQLYDAHAQRQRAVHYAEYMNRINAATQQAIKDNALIELIKRDTP
jgi:hypothetical protein